MDREQPQSHDEPLPTASAPATERLRVGATLSRSLSIYVRHLPVLALLSVALFVPLLFLQLRLMEQWSDSRKSPDWANSVLVLAALYFLLPLLLQIFVTLAVFQHLHGDRVRPLRSILRGLLSLLPALGLALLFLLIMAGVLLALAIPMGLIGGAVGEPLFAGLLNGIVSLLAMAWVFCIYFVAPQALVVEHLFPWRALGRSLELTRGSRWRIFAILVLLVVVLWVANLAVTVAFPGGAGAWVDLRLSTSIRMGLVALVAAFASVCAAVAYHDLRRVKEGVGIDELIQVFE